jgi:hypothetical protein
MAVAALALALALAAPAPGCASLPDLAAGTCGNHVVEANEDCDGFALDATSVCIEKGAAGQCHLDCAPRADGSRPSCPAGWGCGVQGLCRPPTGEFEASPELAVGGASLLMTGDFDGDGRADVLDLETPGIRGVTKLRLHYFDGDGNPGETRAFPKPLYAPVITRPPEMGKSNIVFCDARFSVSVLLGQGDRSFVPEAFSAYRLSGALVRMIAVRDLPIGDASAVVVLTTIGGVPGFYVFDQGSSLRHQGDLPGPLEALVGEPVTGDVIEDPATSPCRELVLAVRGATAFSMVDTCTRGPDGGDVVWRDAVVASTITLDPPMPIDAAPILVDLNADGHLDVLVGAGGKPDDVPYVAWGDGRGLTATAVPYRLELANPQAVSPDIPMPLAAGDVTGDGVVDFVLADGLLVSMPAPSGAGPPVYAPVRLLDPAHWTTARIADLNGNGKPDVVAASSEHLGIDFFNGTGTPNLLPFSLPTSGKVAYLAATDLDGDLIDDLAFVESASAETERDTLRVAFGNPNGAPEPAVPVARIAHIEQLGVLREFGRGNLVVASTESGPTGTDSVLAVLAGSGDRLPFAPYRLIGVSPTGMLTESPALGVTVGAFSGGGQDQVMALATQGNPQLDDYQFWLLPGLQNSDGRAVDLGGHLDPRLQPLYVEGPGPDPATGMGADLGLSLLGAAADLDGDGRSEALWMMAADDTTRCGLLIVDAPAGDGGSSEIAMRDPIILDAPCQHGQLLPVDADGDGHVDVALLTGAAGQAERQLLVLWNDGTGGLDSDHVTTVLDDRGEPSPGQFTVLPATASRPLGFAYVTDRGVFRVAATRRGARDFGAPEVIAEIPQGTGIVAADVNGDGVLDLAVAVAGNLRVLKAKLASP